MFKAVSLPAALFYIPGSWHFNAGISLNDAVDDDDDNNLIFLRMFTGGCELCHIGNCLNLHKIYNVIYQLHYEFKQLS